MESIFTFAKKNRKMALVVIDIILIICSFYMSYYILNDSVNLIQAFDIRNIGSIIFFVLIYEMFLNFFFVYKNITRYENGKDYLIYIFACALSGGLSIIVGQILNSGIMTLKLCILNCMIIIVGIVSYRVIIRMILISNFKLMYKKNKENKVKAKKLLLIGAGSASRDIIKTIKETMRHEYEIVGIIDDNKNKIDYSISGIKVLGDRNSIERLCQKHSVDVIFFTIPDINAKDKKSILDKCQKTGAKIRILPSTEHYIRNKNVLQSLRDIDIEDVLCRDPITLDNENIHKLIEDQVVLVTGGGGSIGSELCKQIICHNPKQLVIVDIYENNLYDLEIELKSKYDPSKIKAIIASVRDLKRLESIFKQYNPVLVFHAAAHKHVPLMEASPLEAIKNNVFGTYNVINTSDKFNVEKFILISSDKAVNSTNIMGATKRLCEMMVQVKDKVSKTKFVAVRFGNVLGSNGSVVPLFKKQIAAGGPITVTDKRITRYFMTIPEAVGLVLQAITYADGGEIFVLDMGKPVKIYDLALNLIKLAGLEPNVDIEIKVVGLRPGEKLYEELLMAEEGLDITEHKKIFVAKPLEISVDDIEYKIALLKVEVEKENANIKLIKSAIKNVVPTYTGEDVDAEVIKQA